MDGKVEGRGLKGKLSLPKELRGYSAYEIAVIHGFKGTEAEWLLSLKGGSGSSNAGATTTLAQITILASAWVGEHSPYSQVVEVAGVTDYSKVDLQPSVEQLAIFHEKDLAFVTENEDGVVTVYAIGDKPQNDYTMQATITEVVV